MKVYVFGDDIKDQNIVWKELDNIKNAYTDFSIVYEMNGSLGAIVGTWCSWYDCHTIWYSNRRRTEIGVKGSDIIRTTLEEDKIDLSSIELGGRLSYSSIIVNFENLDSALCFWDLQNKTTKQTINKLINKKIPVTIFNINA